MTPNTRLLDAEPLARRPSALDAKDHAERGGLAPGSRTRRVRARRPDIGRLAITTRVPAAGIPPIRHGCVEVAHEASPRDLEACSSRVPRLADVSSWPSTEIPGNELSPLPDSNRRPLSYHGSSEGFSGPQPRYRAEVGDRFRTRNAPSDGALALDCPSVIRSPGPSFSPIADASVLSATRCNSGASAAGTGH
jgi:hypothetical protein